jgi:hypothetical protein
MKIASVCGMAANGATSAKACNGEAKYQILMKI